jgi:hypothetical protein
MTSESKPDLDAICRELLAGDKSVRERLILAALPKIVSCVRRLQASQTDAEQQDAGDLQSEAVAASLTSSTGYRRQRPKM